MSRLTPPVSQGDHRAGADDAPVTLVEYGDYECPYCGRAHPIVQQLQRRMEDQLRFVFRNFPLAEMHPHAMRAAEAAEAAGAQGKYWQMHDRLFERQDALEDADLLAHAGDIGVDVRRMARELASGTHVPRIREHFLSGVRSGVNGTPTFFINGIRHDGAWDLKSLAAAVLAARN